MIVKCLLSVSMYDWFTTWFTCYILTQVAIITFEECNGCFLLYSFNKFRRSLFPGPTKESSHDHLTCNFLAFSCLFYWFVHGPHVLVLHYHVLSFVKNFVAKQTSYIYSISTKMLRVQLAHPYYCKYWIIRIKL